MASTSETGHLKNVTNLEKLITHARNFGNHYQPTNPQLLITALDDQHAKATADLQRVKDEKVPYKRATGDRKTIFAPLDGLSTRIMAAAESGGLSQSTINDARAANRKLQGERAPGTPKTKTNGKSNPDTISASQQSYDRQAHFFQDIITILKNEPMYNPNEAGLKITALETYYGQLIAANKAVEKAAVPYSKSLIARNNTLYAQTTGITDTAKSYKSYIKSVFGATSPEYALIKGIEFKSQDNQ